MEQERYSGGAETASDIASSLELVHSMGRLPSLFWTLQDFYSVPDFAFTYIIFEIYASHMHNTPPRA